MSIQTDTIAAVATPAGPGAIGILRLSGPRAADIAAAGRIPGVSPADIAVLSVAVAAAGAKAKREGESEG